MRKIVSGDRIKIGATVYVVAEVYSCDWYDPEGYFVEFRDTKGRLHYWKEYLDGGKLLDD